MGGAGVGIDLVDFGEGVLGQLQVGLAQQVPRLLIARIAAKIVAQMCGALGGVSSGDLDAGEGELRVVVGGVGCQSLGQLRPGLGVAG